MGGFTLKEDAALEPCSGFVTTLVVLQSGLLQARGKRKG